MKPRASLTFSSLLLFSAVACSPTGRAGEGTRGKPDPAPRPAAAQQTAPSEPVTESAARPHEARTPGWTAFRGNEARTGHATIRGPRTARLKWVFRTAGRIWADAAVTSDGNVYVASHDGRLYSIDPDGRERWSVDTGGKIWTSPVIGKDGTVYVGSDNDRLIAIDERGQEKWAFSTAQPATPGDRPEAGRYDVDTSPAIAADGTIIFGCHTTLYALRPNGMVRWHFQAGVGKSKIFSSPALGPDGTIYFGTQGRYFFALNQSAKVLWSLKTGGDNDGTPAVGADGTVYFGSDDGLLRALAPGGTLRWEHDTGAPLRSPIAVGADSTIIASTYGTRPFVVALNGGTGDEKWRFHIQPGEGAYYGIRSGALIDRDGYVYFGGRDHFVYCLSPTGQLVWKYETGDQVDSGPVLGPDGTLYVGSDDKRLYAFAPDGPG